LHHVGRTCTMGSGAFAADEPRHQVEGLELLGELC